MDIRNDVFSDSSIISNFVDPKTGQVMLDEKTNEPIWIEIHGAHTNEFQNFLEIINWHAKKKTGDGVADHEPTLEETNSRIARDDTNVALLVKTWGGFYDNGEPAAPSVENVVLVFAHAPSIRKDVNLDIIKKLPGLKSSNPK